MVKPGTGAEAPLEPEPLEELALEGEGLAEELLDEEPLEAEVLGEELPLEVMDPPGTITLTW
jgi:hypothetical protein